MRVYNVESPKQDSRTFNSIMKTKYIDDLGIVYLWIGVWNSFPNEVKEAGTAKNLKSLNSVQAPLREDCDARLRWRTYVRAQENVSPSNNIVIRDRRRSTDKYVYIRYPDGYQT